MDDFKQPWDMHQEAPEQQPWDMYDDAEARVLQFRYGDRKLLGERWAELRKELEKISSTTPEGKENPLYIRAEMQVQMARMEFDMAYLLQANNILTQQMELLSGLWNRVRILEGAYGSLSMANNTMQMDYKNRLAAHLSERRSSMPPRPRGLDEIVEDATIKQQLKENDNGK